jgi:hypothetical protein
MLFGNAFGSSAQPGLFRELAQLGDLGIHGHGMDLLVW